MSVYAVSDLHGCYDLYKQICNFIKPKDKVIFLGDAGDRGPDSWKTIKAIYENSQWIYLKGNHEDMLMKAMKALKGEETPRTWEDRWEDPISSCYYNGGESTINSWIADGSNVIWINRLKNLDLICKYINLQCQEIILTHAGFTDKNILPTEEDLLWDRTHFYNPPEHFKTDNIIVHGHTPIFYLAKKLHRTEEVNIDDLAPFWYCDNHKVDIDCGSFQTNQTILLDLDSFEWYHFKTSLKEEYHG